MNRANVGWHLANMKDNEHLIAGSASGVGPSPAIWSNCPYLPIMFDPTKGFVYFNDFFTGFTDLAASGWGGDLYLHETDTATLKNLPTVPGGIVEIAGDTTEDDGATVRIPCLQCEPKEGTTIYMEWRCNVEAGGGQMFMGLMSDAENTPVDSSDAISSDDDFVGFFRDAGTTDLYWSVGVCDGSSSEEADDKVLTDESAYHKYGIILRGIGAVSGSRAEFYYDGELVYVADDVDDLPLLLMCPVFQAHGDGTDTSVINLDWIRVAVHNVDSHCRES